MARCPIGFELCGADGFLPLRDRGTARRRALRAPNATEARACAWLADSPVVTLFDGTGLPAGPFELEIAQGME